MMDNDAIILRRLGEQFATAASSPVNAEKARLWTKLNDREQERPMVWINEIPWHEMNVEERLSLECEDPFLRSIEDHLRKRLYEWEFMPGDMVIRPILACPKVWTSTDIGLEIKEETIPQHRGGGILSHAYIPQIKEPEDLEKIRDPVVEYDAEASMQHLEVLRDIFDGLLDVRLWGIEHIWFTPWDNLFHFVDRDTFMYDMIDRPEFVDAMVKRYVDAKLVELDQFVELGLLDTGVTNNRVGSGGYGYTSELLEVENSSNPVQPGDCWGCGNAQIFSEISEEMHWEFSLKHELRWLERFHMTYYGCCEPLHNKMGIIPKIPNLRKISCSPWCDIPKLCERGGEAYVLSIKPNPAIFAEDPWNPVRARAEIRRLLDQTKGCNVEIIMKDISTVRDDPRRLWEWAQIVSEEVQRG